MRAASSASSGCCSQVRLVEPAEQVELRAAARASVIVGGAVEVVDRRALRLERGPLEDAGQEARAPVLRVALGQAAAERVVHDARTPAGSGSRVPRP